MSDYQTIRNAREGFFDSSIGDTLVYTESRIVGIALFFVALFSGQGMISALALGILCCLVIPWLIGTIKILGLVFGIVFSVFWGVLSYFIIGSLWEMSSGSLNGNDVSSIAFLSILIFCISMFMHRIFSGIGFKSVRRHVVDAIDHINYSTQTLNNTEEDDFDTRQVNSYCIYCGCKLKAGARFCNQCGERID